MKFHYSSCSTIKHPERFVEFSNRDDAIAAGYVPCKRCNP
ncbi:MULTISPECIES: Ada metal-binding domain-containing protein [Selenomonas]|nr:MULTISPECIES: Ada metal-binding domain-containing protein [Selenomonas]